MLIQICDKCKIPSEPFSNIYSKPDGWEVISFTFRRISSNSFNLCPDCLKAIGITAKEVIDSNADLLYNIIYEIVKEVTPNV